MNPLETRILLLERRIVELERRLEMHPAPGCIEPATLAIIAAAVAASGYGRIRYATRVSHVGPINLWADQGRQEHFYSHRVR